MARWKFKWSVRLGQQENIAQDAQKGRPAIPQRAKRRRRTLRYVELLSEARTPLADFFSILLDGVMGGDEEGSQVPEPLKVGPTAFVKIVGQSIQVSDTIFDDPEPLGIKPL
ncbi:MAG: hypothetical protein JJE16_01205, partial [Nitrospiraceae bacterium]|nr:hypothetical protein [Nitrospiraceae bacterium]